MEEIKPIQTENIEQKKEVPEYTDSAEFRAVVGTREYSVEEIVQDIVASGKVEKGVDVVGEVREALEAIDKLKKACLFIKGVINTFNPVSGKLAGGTYTGSNKEFNSWHVYQNDKGWFASFLLNNKEITDSAKRIQTFRRNFLPGNHLETPLEISMFGSIMECCDDSDCDRTFFSQKLIQMLRNKKNTESENVLISSVLDKYYKNIKEKQEKFFEDHKDDFERWKKECEENKQKEEAAKQQQKEQNQQKAFDPSI